MSDPLWVSPGAGDAVGTAALTAASDTFTLAGHGLVDGTPVVLSNLTGGVADTITSGGIYYLRNVTDDTFQLAETRGGPVIVFDTDGGADVATVAGLYSPRELRRAAAAWLFPGVAGRTDARAGVRPGHTPVSLSGDEWTVHDCVGVIGALSSGAGPYPFQHEQESDTIDPADGASDRIDRIDLQVQDDDEDGSGFRRTRAVYTAGVPGSGSAPPPVASSIEFGLINVPASGTGSPSLTVTARWTVGPGGILPVRDSSEWPTSGLHEGMGLWDMDLQALLGRTAAGQFEILAKPGGGFGVVGYDQLTSEVAVSGTSSPGTLLCSTSVAVTTDRRYRIVGKCRWRVDSAGDRTARLGLLVDGSTVATSTVPVSNQTAANGPMDHISRQVFVPTADATIDFDLYGFRATGGTSLLAAASSGVPVELLVEDIGPA